MAATMNEGNAQHAWDLMKKITFAMLATRDGERSGRARWPPM